MIFTSLTPLLMLEIVVAVDILGHLRIKTGLRVRVMSQREVYYTSVISEGGVGIANALIECSPTLFSPRGLILRF